MPRIIIVVADAAHARLISYEPDESSDGAPGGHLIERRTLENPEGRLRDGDLFTETRPPLSRSPFGPISTVDDHRDQHVRELEHRFAGVIVKNLDEVLDTAPATQVVVAVGPRMLGLLRQAITGLRHRDVALDDVALDLSKERTPQLHDHLAGMGFIPPRLRLMRAARR